jgi:hypothetical protein
VNIETLIYNVIKADVPNTYRHRSPTPGTGTYVVLDMVTDTSTPTKDSHIEPSYGGRVRMLAKCYGPDATALRTLADTVQNTIRTTTNHTESGMTWIYATDTSITNAYDPKTERYTYIIEFIIHYS